MVCDGYIERLREEEREAARKRRKEAISKLKKKIKDKKVIVGKNKDGQMGLVGWEDVEREGYCDGCAFATLNGDPEFEKAKMEAVEVEDHEIKVGH